MNILSKMIKNSRLSNSASKDAKMYVFFLFWHETHLFVGTEKHPEQGAGLKIFAVEQ